MSEELENPVGLPVWPVGYQTLAWSEVSTSGEEHRAFPKARAEAMLRFVWDVQEAVRDVEGRPDDGRGLLRQRFLGRVMQAEARYREALEPGLVRADAG
jgi:hypothetical protein